MKFSNKVKFESSSIQIAPLIDVVFLLLIFFIVTWSFARFETEMDISVPATEEGKEPDRVFGEIIINLASDGKITVNGKKRELNELENMLSEIAKIRKGQPVILRMDKKTDAQKIVNVLAICHKANIYHIAFATSKPQ